MTETAATNANNNPDYLNLKVKSQVLFFFKKTLEFPKDGEEVFFKIKKTTQFRKLMEAYCQRQTVIFQGSYPVF